LYGGVDPELQRPVQESADWELGYLGAYSLDRQPALNTFLIDVARRSQGRFVIAGPGYPASLDWPANVDGLEHVPPAAHSQFFGRQRFTLNLTRREMRRAGYAPSVRLFEAAACGTAIISDVWPGLAESFEPFLEILPAANGRAVEHYLRDLPEAARLEIGERARQRVLSMHTAAHRARTLEEYVDEVLNRRPDSSDHGDAFEGTPPPAPRDAGRRVGDKGEMS
jgi:spore maturation protein CgeB